MKTKCPSQVFKTVKGLETRIATLSKIGIVLGLSVSLMLPTSPAMALEISYSGRLMEESGKSIEGPQDFTVRFYNVPSQGDVVGPTLKLANTELIDGVFQLSLNLDNNHLTAIFGDGTKAAYVEVEAGGKVYPRQRLIAVPLALRVPVDTNYLNYTDGKLKIESVDLNQVNGLSAALAAKADTSAVTSTSVATKNLSDLTNAPAARTNLGLGSLATANTISNAEISSTAAIADTKLATISTAGKVSGSSITSGTIGGTTAFQSSGDITTTGTLNAGTVTTAQQNGIQLKPFSTGAGNTGELRFGELLAGGTNYVGFKAPDALAANNIWTLPIADGTNGQILKTDGSGNLDWISVGGTGTVTSVNLAAPAAGISVSGGPITGAGSITLALGDDLAAVEALSSTGSVERTGANTWGTYTVTAAGKALIDDGDATTQRTTLGLGSLATLSTVGSTEITNDSIMDADINTSAAIATSKLSGAVTSIASHGLGSLATLSAVGSTEITNDSIMNTDINASAAIADTKLATISTAGKVSGSAITSGTIGGTTVIATSGQLSSTGNIRVSGTGVTATDLRFGDSDDSNYVGFKAPATVGTNLVWTLPAADGTANQALSTNASGVLQWVSPMLGSNNLSDLSNAGTARTNLGLGTLATGSAVTSAMITDDTIVDADINASAAIADTKLATISTAGKVSGSAITSGTIGGSTVFNTSGAVTTSAAVTGQNVIVNSTGSAATELRFNDDNNSNYVGFKSPSTVSANRVWTLPAADGTNGQLLKTDGSGALSWVSDAGSVTSVNLTAPAAGITVSGGPVTTSGSITLALADDLAAVEGISTTGGVERTASNTWSTYTLTAAGKALIDDADATAQRTTLGLGALATAAAVSGGTAGTITDDTITNADINSAAAIADTKLATISTAGKVSGSAITSGTIGGTTAINTSGLITTSGNVGIGSTSPSTKLQVNSGSISTVSQYSKGTYLIPYYSNDWRTGIGFNLDSDGTNYTALPDSANGAAAIMMDFPGNLHFYSIPSTGTTTQTIGHGSLSAYERMNILTNGNVGIGTTAPAGLLDVNGKLTVLSGGNVGIGTTSPGGLIDVGAASEFRVASTGDVTKIKGVAYSWPSSQGGASTVLTNNGSGTLSWAAAAATTGTGGGAAPNPSSGCPTGYILVPGDTDFGTTDFCVMKYEAKYDNKGAASFAIGLPARMHDQGRAASACRNLGPGYALINNAEWMTLASNAANVGANWSSGTVGTGALNRGHSDNAPADALAAVTDDNDPCNGTGQTCSSSTWHDQRRTHVLSNSNVIWDLAGNVWEWVDYYNRDNKPTPATGAWYEFTAITGSTVMPKTMLVPTTAVKAWWNNSWNGATNGIGQMNPGSQNSGGALFRGGHWGSGAISGLFTMALADDPTVAYTTLGFRCVFRPSSP